MKLQFLVTEFIISLIFLPSCQTKTKSINLVPEGTVIHGNIAYNNDTLKKHLLDIYLPVNSTGHVPLIVWIHGGGWLSNDKYADLDYMKSTIAELLESGYGVASIDYRFSTDAVFPAQIQDCNKAISFLYDNAEKFGLDKDRFALIGFSAGGHLASLIALSKNNEVSEFFIPNSSKSFDIKAVVDFYGPTELVLSPRANDPNSPEGKLIGAAPLDRPDLARIASPVTYVDKNDPPFLIIHGEKDDIVSPNHSRLLSGWLSSVGVENKLVIVKDAPHYGPQFDVDEVRAKVMEFLKRELE